jgi:anti-sigma B factor antagonist
MTVDPGQDHVLGGTVPDDARGGQQLEIATRHLPTAVVVAVVGEVDMATADQFAATVQAAIDSRSGVILIDLTGVEFFCSSGLAVLAAADQSARQGGQLLRVVVGDRHLVTRPLAMTGLTDYLTLFRRFEDALAAPADSLGDTIASPHA